MPRRTIGFDSSAPRNEVTGSIFDSNKPPDLPRGLTPGVRTEAKRILIQNVHLWGDDQLAPVVRLATLRIRRDEMEEQVRTEGYTLDHDKKGVIAHPLIASLNATGNAILGLERALAIVFITRGNQVKEAEKNSTVPALEYLPDRLEHSDFSHYCSYRGICRNSRDVCVDPNPPQRPL